MFSDQEKQPHIYYEKDIKFLWQITFCVEFLKPTQNKWNLHFEQKKSNFNQARENLEVNLSKDS